MTTTRRRKSLKLRLRVKMKMRDVSLMGWQGSAEKENEMVSGRKGGIVSSTRELEAQ